MTPEETTPERPWYKKKRYILPSLFIAILAIIGASQPSPSPSSSIKANAIQAPTSTYHAPLPQNSFSNPAPTSVHGLSNNNYYTNVDGNSIHSPAYSDSVPSGASAQCRDGTYSFSAHRQGTCSHHGGVSRWL